MEAWIYSFVIFLGVYLSCCLIIYLIQDLFYFHPEKLPFEFIFESRHQFHIPLKEVFIPTSDENLINGLHYKIRDPKGVVFYFKGNTKSIKGWGKFSKDFVSKNYDFFTVDYPGFGKSTGKRTEALLYNYMQTAYDWLRERYPEDKIIIYGRSMGGGFAAKVASGNKPAMLILEATYFSFYHLAQYYAPIFPTKWLLKFKIPTFRFLDDVSCPVYFIHGTKDWLIPFRFSVWMHKRISKRSRLFAIRKAKHNNLLTYTAYHKITYALLNNPAFKDLHQMKSIPSPV
jgi:alpha/beta superfamily hydrolase